MSEKTFKPLSGAETEKVSLLIYNLIETLEPVVEGDPALSLWREDLLRVWRGVNSVAQTRMLRESAAKGSPSPQPSPPGEGERRKAQVSE